MNFIKEIIYKVHEFFNYDRIFFCYSNMFFLQRKIKGSENKRNIFRKRKVHGFYKRKKIKFMNFYFNRIFLCKGA